MYTDVSGNTNAAKTTTYCFGPYLQKVPTNQFNNLNTITIDGTAGDGSAGWEFSSTTGAFNADDNATHAAL